MNLTVEKATDGLPDNTAASILEQLNYDVSYL